MRRRRWPAAVLAGGAALTVGPPVAAAPSSISFRIVGLSRSIPTAIDTGPCPQGEWSTALYAASTPRRIGTTYGCGLTIRKRDQPGYGLLWIKQRARVTYILPGGTITTIESQTFRFDRDQHHSHTSGSGRVLKGTGHYAQVRGTIHIDGDAVDGRARYRVRI
jgi:hypothetical protein